MDFFLNKIEPQIVKKIKQTTATGVVHQKDDLSVSKEETNQEKPKDKKHSKRQIKEKIEKLNSIADQNQLDIFFVLEEARDELWIKVFERNTNRCIKTFDEEEIEELINRLQNVMGMIVDVKG